MMSKSSFRSLFVWSSLALVLLVNPAFGSEVRSLSVRGVRVEPSGGLTVFLKMKGGENNSLSDLDPSQIVLEIDGKKVNDLNMKSLPFAKSGEGRALLLAVDTSGSMAGGMTAVKNSLSQYLISMRPSLDKIAIGKIGSEWSLVHNFSADHASLKKTIESLTANDQGTTALFESIDLGIGVLRNPSDSELPSRRSLLIISDGLNEKLGRTMDECISSAKRALIQVHSLLFLTKPNAKLLAAKGEIEKISRDSNGLTMTIAQPNEFSNAFFEMQKEFDSEVVLTVNGSGIPTDGSEHSIQLRYQQGSDGFKFIARNIRSSAPSNDDKKCDASQPVGNGDKNCQPAEVKPPQAKSNGVWIALSAGGVLLLGGGLWLLLSRRRQAELAEPILQEPVVAPVEQLDFGSAAHQPEIAMQAVAPVEVEERRTRKTEYRAAGVAIQGKLALRVTGGECAGLYLVIPSQGATIGRETGNDFVLASDSVSSRHAEITSFTGGNFAIRDLGSTNGTFVNNSRVASEPLELKAGMKVRLGAVLLDVEAV